MATFSSKLSNSVARKPASPAVNVAHVYRRSVLTRAPRKRTFIMVEMTRYTPGAVAAGAEQIQIDGGDWNNNCGGGNSDGNGRGGRGDGRSGDSNSNNDEGRRGGLATLVGALAVMGVAGLLQPKSLRASTMEDGAGLPPATSSLGLLCLSLDARAARRIAAAAAAAAERRASGALTHDEELVYGSVGLSSWERRVMRVEQCQPRQRMRVGF